MANPTAERQAAYERGLEAERQAESLLLTKGFTVLARRVKQKGGEVDLIADDGETLALVEVKARKDETSAMEAVSARQQARIRAAARAWLAEGDNSRFLATHAIRCDVIVVAPASEPLHIEDAFPAADEAGL